MLEDLARETAHAWRAWQQAPGAVHTAEHLVAAIRELAEALGADPVALRRFVNAEMRSGTKLGWAIKHALEQFSD